MDAEAAVYVNSPQDIHSLLAKHLDRVPHSLSQLHRKELASDSTPTFDRITWPQFFHQVHPNHSYDPPATTGTLLLKNGAKIANVKNRSEHLLRQKWHPRVYLVLHTTKACRANEQLLAPKSQTKAAAGTCWHEKSFHVHGCRIRARPT